MGVLSGPSIVLENLLLSVDFGNIKSYDKYENLLTQSNTDVEFSNGANPNTWTSGYIDPLGSTTAKLCTTDNRSFKEYINSSVNNVVSTFSIYLKTNGSSVTRTLDLKDISTDTTRSTKSITITTEWQRFSITGTVQANGIRVEISGGIQNIYAWGAQLEIGSNVSTYYPTTTTGKTRATQALNLLSSFNNLSLLNQSYYNFTEINSGSIDLNRTIYPTAENGAHLEKTGITGDLSALNYLHNSHTTEIWFRSDDRNPYDAANTAVTYETNCGLLLFNGFHSGWWYNSTSYNYTIWGKTGTTNQTYDLGFNDFTSGVWTQLVAVRNGNTLTLYKNGVSQTSGTITCGAEATPSANNIRIGSATGSAASSFTWWADITFSMLRMYKTPLTAAQVQQNFNATRGRFGI